MTELILTPARGRPDVIISSKRKFDPTRTLDLMTRMRDRATRDNAVLAQTAMLTALQGAKLRIEQAMSIYPDGPQRDGMLTALRIINSLYEEMEHE